MLHPQCCCNSPTCQACNDYDDPWWGKGCDWDSFPDEIKTELNGLIMDFGPMNLDASTVSDWPYPAIWQQYDINGLPRVQVSEILSIPGSWAKNFVSDWGTQGGWAYVGMPMGSGTIGTTVSVSDVKARLTCWNEPDPPGATFETNAACQRRIGMSIRATFNISHNSCDVALGHFGYLGNGSYGFRIMEHITNVGRLTYTRHEWQQMLFGTQLALTSVSAPASGWLGTPLDYTDSSRTYKCTDVANVGTIPSGCGIPRITRPYNGLYVNTGTLTGWDGEIVVWGSVWNPNMPNQWMTIPNDGDLTGYPSSGQFDDGRWVSGRMYMPRGFVAGITYKEWQHFRLSKQSHGVPSVLCETLEPEPDQSMTSSLHLTEQFQEQL